MANSTDPDDQLILTGTFGSRKRKGVWSVPRLIIIDTKMGSTELDFTAAEFQHDALEVQVTMFGGSIEFRVPADAGVTTNRVTTRLASVEDHRKTPPTKGSPQIDIVGSLTWGSLEIRGPR